ncbi:MAG: GDCCVxC domain-containing (seleno)protein [Nanoarchaeota archaeon]
MPFTGNIICPSCKTKSPVTLHKNVCMYFFQCPSCKKMLQAKEGCCVFCDYGDRKCPVVPHPKE